MRVQEGGHHIPEAVIRRRYEGGLRNFFNLYQPIVDSWMLVDNSGQSYQVIARSNENKTAILADKIWNTLKAKYDG